MATLVLPNVTSVWSLGRVKESTHVYLLLLSFYNRYHFFPTFLLIFLYNASDIFLKTLVITEVKTKRRHLYLSC